MWDSHVTSMPAGRPGSGTLAFYLKSGGCGGPSTTARSTAEPSWVATAELPGKSTRSVGTSRRRLPHSGSGCDHPLT